VVKVSDSNSIWTYLILFEGAGSNPAVVGIFMKLTLQSSLVYEFRLHIFISPWQVVTVVYDAFSSKL
jgi:hypothetical protein